MIYLTRTTIELDGTRTTEIAALEDGAWLKRYEAQGFTPCSYDTYSVAWRAKALAQRAGIETKQPSPASATPVSDTPVRCKRCNNRQVSQSAHGHRYCLVCKYEWDV